MIVILSEANAGLMFGDDLRQHFLWVDGMTDDEASAYAKKEFPAIAEADLKDFIDKVSDFKTATSSKLYIYTYPESLNYRSAQFLCTSENLQVLWETVN